MPELRVVALPRATRRARSTRGGRLDVVAPLLAA